MQQRTIAKPVEMVGIGLHKGVPVRMRLEPLAADEGIIFYRQDKGITIEATPQNVVDTKMATVLGKDGALISTIEHLMSALYAYGIDNVLITIDNDEVPIMDGSAIGYCMLLDEAGIKKQARPKRVLKIKKEVIVEDGEKFVSLKPYEGLIFDFSIAFDHPVIGKERLSFSFSKQSYLSEIAKARTFGFLHEVQYLRSKGLALGGSLDNAIVLDHAKVLNPEGLRYKDEFVRHKILDAMGDLMLLGMPMMGYYTSYAGSHHLNHLLTKALLADKEAFEVLEATSQRRVLAPSYA